MTGLEAVTAATRAISNGGVFGTTIGKVFKYEKEKGYTGEYIVVNSLPFVHRDELETCTVNVNVHVPKLSTEQPNVASLTAIVKNVIALFDSRYGTFINGAYFKFYSDSRPTEDNDNTYYVNIQLDCTFENISKK